jgi:prolipoprotein diacylglyceryltransferase
LTKLENFKAVGYGVIMAIGILAGWWLKFKKQGS